MLPVDHDNHNNEEASLERAEKEIEVKALASSIIENQVFIFTFNAT